MEQNNFLPHSTPSEGISLPGGSLGHPCREMTSRQDRPLNESHEHACGCCVGYEGCGPDSWGLSEYPLAMVYAPCQAFRALLVEHLTITTFLTAYKKDEIVRSCKATYIIKSI